MTIFEREQKIDTSKVRICSVCECVKDLTEFYRDGTTRDGEPKYRRDCKFCYNQKLKAKKKVEPVKAKAAPRGRKKR